MLTNVKKIVVMAVTVSISSLALGDIKKETKNGYSWLISTNLSNVLDSASKGEGYKIEGQRIKLEGWLSSVETAKGNDGTPIFILQIADALSINLPGLRKNSANPSSNQMFYCVTADRSKVVSLNKDMLIKFNADIREVKSNTYPTQYGKRTQYAVLAKCDFL